MKRDHISNDIRALFVLRLGSIKAGVSLPQAANGCFALTALARSNVRFATVIFAPSLTASESRVAGGGAAYESGIEISSRNWRSESMRIS